MRCILPCACGVDVHRDMIEACISTDINGNIVLTRQQFSTSPEDLKLFVQWLYDNNCYHVGMESTGVYWRPVYEAIETHSPYIENIIVGNAAHIKNVPGRKTDVLDAEWLSTLVMHGLISPSFVPNRTIRNLRDAARTYKKFVGEYVRYKNRVDKFLQTHGFKLSGTMKDIFCVSGRNIMNALALRGSLTIDDINSCVRGSLKSSVQKIYDAMSVSISDYEQQLLSLLLKRLSRSEEEIEEIVDLMENIALPYKRTLEIMRSIPGIDKASSLLILAEIGSDIVHDFGSAPKLCCWAGLCPRKDESAQKDKSKKIMPGNQYLKPILNQVA